MADDPSDLGTAGKEIFDNVFRDLGKEDELTKVLRRVAEVGKITTSEETYIKNRILGKGQFFEKQKEFFAPAVIERGLTGVQHQGIFNLAFNQAFTSFGKEEKAMLESTLAGAGRFNTLSANNKIDTLTQALKEGRQTNLLIQLINRGRSSLRPTARHVEAHYGAEAMVPVRDPTTGEWGEKPSPKRGIMPEKLSTTIPGIPGQKLINEIDIRNTKVFTQSLRIGGDAGLAGEFETFLGTFQKIQKEGGIGGASFGGLELLQNTSLRANRNVPAAQYNMKFRYDNRDVTLRIPIITGNNAKIGYTGDNLTVRRVMTPIEVIDTGQEKMTSSIMQRNQYFLARFNREVLPLIEQGAISGRELKAYVKDLHTESFTSQDVASGRAFSYQDYAPHQRRWERETGAATQLVTRDRRGIEYKSGIKPAFVGLTNQQTLRVLDVRGGEFGIDVSENRFISGVLSNKRGQTVSNLPITGDLAVHEFADPRVVQHARLDQKVRNRTMAAESVFAAHRGRTVQQKEYAAMGQEKLVKQIRRWGAHFNIDKEGKAAKYMDTEGLVEQVRKKELGHEDRQWLQKQFADIIHAPGGRLRWSQMGPQGKAAMLESNILSMQSRVEGQGFRKHFTNFLTPQEIALYGMGDNGKRNTAIDNMSMIPTSERPYFEMDENRLKTARGILTGMEEEVLSGRRIKREGWDFRGTTGFSGHAEKVRASGTDYLAQYSTQAKQDAGYLMAVTKNLPYLRGKSRDVIGKILQDDLGIEDIASLIPKGEADVMPELRKQMLQQEEILQVGTMYVDPSKMQGNVTKHFGSGEGIMRDEMRHLMSQEAAMHKTLASINQDAFKMDNAGNFVKVDGQYVLRERNIKMRHTIIGWDQQGKEIVRSKDMRRISFTELDANDGSDNKWLLMEYDELLRPEKHVKLHGDIKQGVSFVKKWKEVAYDLASMMTSGYGKEMMGRGAIDRSVENITEMQFKHGARSHQHIRQIATAMSMQARSFGERGIVDKDLGEMVTDPIGFARKRFALDPDFKGTRKQAHTAQVQEMMNWYLKKGTTLGTNKDITKNWMDPQNFAKVFGLTESVFGKNEYLMNEAGKFILKDGKKQLEKAGYEEMMTKAFRHAGITDKAAMAGLREAAGAGSAYGVARQFLGDPMRMVGAGKMGTMEGRSMMIMTGEAFGERGEEMSKDFLTRMKSYDVSHEGAGKWKVRGEIKKSMETILTPTAIPKAGVSVIDATGTFDATDLIDEMKRKGKSALATGKEVWLDVGDSRGIYLPSMDIPGMAMRTIETRGGEIQASSVLREAFQTYLHDTSTGATDTLEQLQDDLMLHQAEWSKEGMGGVLRGRLPGSRSLVASSRSSTGQTMDAANIVGISQRNADRMVKEMIEHGRYSDEQKEQIGQFSKRLAAGETVGGVISRHPFISSYSLQKTLFKIVDDADDVIVVPEISVDIGGQGPGKMRLKLGAMLGLAGDYDFDAIIASFVDPMSEEVISKEVGFTQSSDYYERYMRHQIRYQKLDMVQEAASGDELLSNMQDAAGRMQVKEKYTGRLSNEMTKVKFAAGSYRPGKEVADIYALTEWLEQKPISAKHRTPKQLETSMSRLVTAFEGAGSANELYLAIQDFVDADTAKDVILSREDVESIEAATKYKVQGIAGEGGSVIIKGFDIEKISENIFAAQQEAISKDLYRRFDTVRGKTKGAAAAKSWKQLQQITRSGIGGAVSMADTMLSNLMGMAGKSGIMNHKGMRAAMAVGSLVGLSQVLSQPQEMVGPGKHLDSRARMNMSKGTKRLRSEDVKPPRAPIGTPTSPNMLSQRRAMISAKPAETNHFLVRGRAEYPSDVALISQQLQQFTSLGNSVNISLQDSRGIPNRYVESNRAY